MLPTSFYIKTPPALYEAIVAKLKSLGKRQCGDETPRTWIFVSYEYFNNSFNGPGEKEISFEEFFAAPEPLTKVKFKVGVYDVALNKEEGSIGCQKIKTPKLLAALNQIEEFWAKGIELPERFYIDVLCSEISAIVQKKLIDLGYYWYEGKTEVYPERNRILSIGYDKDSGKRLGWDRKLYPESYADLAQIFLEDLFAPKRLTIPAGVFPGYDIEVHETFVEVADLTMNIAEFTEFAAKVRDICKK